jgi:hypothetical protein
MKKILTIAALIIGFSATCLAQHTTPRFGTAPNQDNTYRGMTLGLVYAQDTLGATTDTVLINLDKFTNHVSVTLKDSCVLAFRTVASNWFGDQLTVLINNTAGASHFVNFLGWSGYASGSTQWRMAAAGTKISPVASKTAILRFFFDGVKWVEAGRTQE